MEQLGQSIRSPFSQDTRGMTAGQPGLVSNRGILFVTRDDYDTYQIKPIDKKAVFKGDKTIAINRDTLANVVLALVIAIYEYDGKEVVNLFNQVRQFYAEDANIHNRQGRSKTAIKKYFGEHLYQKVFLNDPDDDPYDKQPDEQQQPVWTGSIMKILNSFGDDANRERFFSNFDVIRKSQDRDAKLLQKIMEKLRSKALMLIHNSKITEAKNLDAEDRKLYLDEWAIYLKYTLQKMG